jgi:serine/threonine protein kinase
MHSQGVAHCDIKEPNIMLRTEDLQEPEVVIIDLGVAQRSTETRSVIYGTPGYIAPEVWETKNWCPESDMFSFGVVVVQMLLGKIGIFTENTITFQDIKDATNNRVPPFELMPIEFPSFRDLAKRLLAKDLNARPTAAKMLQEPWQQEVESRHDVGPTLLQNMRRHSCHAVTPNLSGMTKCNSSKLVPARQQPGSLRTPSAIYDAAYGMTKCNSSKLEPSRQQPGMTKCNSSKLEAARQQALAKRLVMQSGAAARNGADTINSPRFNRNCYGPPGIAQMAPTRRRASLPVWYDL